MATPEGFEAFRRDEADLDPERDARVRHHLGQLTRRSPDQGGQSPFEDVPAPISTRRPPAAEPAAVVAAIASPGPGDRPGRSRVLAVAAAVVLVLVGTAVVVRSADDDGDDVLTGVGEQSLADLATRAGERPDQTLGDGEYVYERIDEGATGFSEGQAGTERGSFERWVTAEGTGREVVGERTFVDDATGQAAVIVAAGDVSYDTSGSLAISGYDYQRLRELPRQPIDLAVNVFADRSGGPDDAHWQLELLVELLMAPVAPPEVRAAAFLALADLGLQPVGEVTDSIGRRGVGFVLSEGGSTALVIVDPVTTAIFEVRTGPGSEPPTSEGATTWRTLLESRVTTSRD
jgi:hypothetical protein